MTAKSQFYVRRIKNASHPYYHDVDLSGYNYRGGNSMWVNGKLVLRSNQLTVGLSERLLNPQELQRAYDSYNMMEALRRNPIAQTQLYLDFNGSESMRLYNNAYARLRGRLYKGSAALGVTVGTYKESRQMVVDRAKQLALRADEAAARLATARNKRKVLSGTYLEVIFGWTPLLADIHAATSTVINQDPVITRVPITGRSATTLVDELVATSAGGKKYRTGKLACACSAMVSVRNQNLWLAERAGLLNGAAVVWDLVPWSFVVNMFMNTGQLVGTVTDFAGLTFENTSVTHSFRGVYDGYGRFGGAEMHLRRAVIVKRRTVGQLPPPTFMFKLPEANWQLAGIAGALLVQKFSAFNRVFQGVKNMLGRQNSPTI